MTYYISGGTSNVIIGKNNNNEIIKQIKFNENNFRLILNELRALTILKHKNIIKLYNYSIKDGLINIKLEYGGVPIIVFLLNNQLKYDDLEKLKSDLLKAIQYIHSNGFYHGDLSTNNILIDDNLNIKIIDFGSCQRINDTELYRPTSDIRDSKNNYKGVYSDYFAYEVICKVIDTLIIPKGNDKDKISINTHKYIFHKNYINPKTINIVKSFGKKINYVSLTSLQLFSKLIEKDILLNDKIKEQVFSISDIIHSNSKKKFTQRELIELLNILSFINYDYGYFFDNITNDLCEKIIYYSNNSTVIESVFSTLIEHKINNFKIDISEYLNHFINSNIEYGQIYKIIKKYSKIKDTIKSPIFLFKSISN